MIPLIGAPREMAVQTIQTIALPRYGNVTGLVGGFNQTNQTPDWAPNILGIVQIYPDFLGPMAFVIIFSLPFLMMWLSHGNMKLLGVLGFVVGLYVLLFLPANFQVAAFLCMIIAAVGFLWGLFKQ